MFSDKKIILFNLAIVGLILVLPYYIFEGKLFIGGDDTRLFYIFPYEWIKNFAFFSWFNFSSLGLYNPNQFIIPFLLLLIPIKAVIQNTLIINYAIFSLVLVFGFISFQLLIPQIIDLKKEKERLIVLLGSLFYIFSPLLMINPLSAFLYSVWLIGFFPLIAYLFIKFLKTNDFKYAILGAVFSVIFSIALISFPWTLGSLLSLLPAFLFGTLLYSRRDILNFIRKSFIFFGILVLSQSFWILSLVLIFIFPDRGSLQSQVFSVGYDDYFFPTVIQTASGNIIYPLLNLFQRKMAFDFHWSQETIFLTLYDKTFLLNLIFPAILFSGLFLYKKVLNSSEGKLFAITLIAFLASLFLFTVNVGFLKHLFLALGYLPGFFMFANFWNKFDLSYILLYSVVLTLSLLVINRKVKNRVLFYLISSLFFLAIVINALPIKNLVNAPIWTTKNTYSNIIIPKEYSDFMADLKTNVNSTSNILSLPFGIANYGFIKGENSNSVFIGTSPIKLFTGVNDFSGELSFSPEESERLKNYMENKNYEEVNTFFEEYNLNYILIVKSLSGELKKSYLFENKSLDFEYKELLEAVTDEKLLTSTNGNYELYSTKNESSLFVSENLSFQKLSPVKYKLSIKNLKEPQELLFLDSFNSDWKLFLKPNFNSYSFGLEDLSFTWREPIFDATHDLIYGYANLWVIDPENITSNYSDEFYIRNSDDTINIDLILYFRPQNYFYFGSLISAITVASLGMYLIKRSLRHPV